MKNSTNGNIYETTLRETWDLFAAHLGGARASTVCVVSFHELSPSERNALESSAAMLGYGRNGCTYLTLSPETADAQAAPLDASALFLLIEGLDPLVLIATHQSAVEALGEAYRQRIAPNTVKRLFGREVVAFASFESMLETKEDKQTAWSLLKMLPKFGEH